MDDFRVILTLAGTLSVLVAALAWTGDRRRMRRTSPDDVGFMPWTTLFFGALIAALVLLGLAARAWLGG